MSIKLMTQVWALELDPSRKLVLLALADNANDEGHCWPSITTIAAKCSMGRSTVIRSLQELETLRHITRSGEAGKTTSYTVHPCQADTSIKLTPVSRRDGTRVTVTPPPVSTRDGTRVTVTPRTIIEPSLEPSRNRHTYAGGLDFDHEQQIQAEYPKFSGRQNWTIALKAAGSLVSDGLATPDELITAVKRYAAYVTAGGVSEPRYVMTPATFFQAQDKPWSQEWNPPAKKLTAMERVYAATGGGRVIDG